jgi:uncharacterized hydantoinase/oxoprolinase family protein
MVCADLETSTTEERHALAERLARRQTDLIGRALDRVAARLPCPPTTIVLAGSGAFLARRALEQPRAFPPCLIRDLGRELGPGLSEAACACAVAVLADESGAFS